MRQQILKDYNVLFNLMAECEELPWLFRIIAIVEDAFRLHQWGFSDLRLWG